MLKENKNKPASPCEILGYNFEGLTKHEYAVIHIAAALAQMQYTAEIKVDVVDDAIYLADEIFEKLDKKKHGQEK